jgi:hypothetical protein
VKPLTTFVVSLVTLALATVASAQTVLRITGAQAFRGVTHTAVTHILEPGFSYGYQGTALNLANAAIFTGSVNGAPVIIKTSWSGSTAGIRTVSQSQSVNFLPNSTAQSTGGTGGAPAASEAAIPDVAATDSNQSSTLYTSPKLVDKIVGVAPYVWVTNTGAPATLSNITPQLAQVLWGNGSAPLALFTGLSSDEGTLVFATGRDPDSGARLIAFAEAGIGVNATVVQYQATITGAAITSHKPWPAETVGGVAYVEGNSGYDSFSALASVMTKTTLAGIGGYYISYFPVPDAANAVAGGAKLLSYNGVSYSLEAVQSGQYTNWGYEHLMYRSSLTAIAKTIADALANQLLSTDATILLGSMRVSRPTDGGLVTALYY